jgi:hypothetical protein
MDPPPYADGSEPPAASASRHNEINRLLAAAISKISPAARSFDISPYVTPNGSFQSEVGGSICRESDGVHFYFGSSIYAFLPTYCGEDLRAAFLPFVRRLVDPKL